MDICSETATGSGIYRREWTKATVEWNCQTHQGTITRKPPSLGATTAGPPPPPGAPVQAHFEPPVLVGHSVGVAINASCGE